MTFDPRVAQVPKSIRRTDKSGTPKPSNVSGLLPELDYKKELVVCILAGGSGSRFWPASTEARPKQFLSFFGERSLLQQSFDRVQGLVPDSSIFVLTSRDLATVCREQLPELPVENVVCEPMRRDTAAAIGLGAALINERIGDKVMAVITADHLIDPVDEFQRALVSAARGASSGEALYTFGISPTRPATEFGYLELGDELVSDEGIAHSALASFVEKPDLATATGYVEADNYLWNSGMFVWRISALLREFERQLPEHWHRIVSAVAFERSDGPSRFAERLEQTFEPLQRVSIDYGVMENASAVRAVCADFSWFDVGSFEALAEHLSLDDAGNASRVECIARDAHRNIVFADDQDELVALLGVDDLIVVRAGKRTLVVPRSRGQEVKQFVAALPSMHR